MDTVTCDFFSHTSCLHLEIEMSIQPEISNQILDGLS